VWSQMGLIQAQIVLQAVSASSYAASAIVGPSTLQGMAVCVAWLCLLLQAMYGARKWRTLAVVSILQAFQQQKTNPYQQVVILVQVRQPGICCALDPALIAGAVY